MDKGRKTVLVCFEPVLAYSTIGDEGDGKSDNALHLLKDNASHLLYLVLGDIEVEFVMHLHNHLRTERFARSGVFLGMQTMPDTDHSHLDDVGGSTLDRGINGIALGERTHGGIVGEDVGEVAFAPKERLGIAPLACQFFLPFDIGNHAREGSEIVIDELLCLGAGAV